MPRQTQAPGDWVWLFINAVAPGLSGKFDDCAPTALAEAYRLVSALRESKEREDAARRELGEAEATIKELTGPCGPCRKAESDAAALRAKLEPTKYGTEAFQSYRNGNRAPWVLDRMASYAAVVLALAADAAPAPEPAAPPEKQEPPYPCKPHVCGRPDCCKTDKETGS